MSGSILFDLDGTLADPFQAFSESLKSALLSHEMAPLTDDEVRKYIGPPLQDSWAEITGKNDPILFESLMNSYRKHHAEVGLSYYRLYPEVESQFKDFVLSFPEERFFVATSKPRIFAKKVLDDLGFSHFFQAIEGPELDGTRARKDDLLKYMIENHAIDPKKAVMIGDRKHDTMAARAVQMKSIGVLWGFGSHEELQNHGADEVIVRFSEISATIRKILHNG